MKAVIVDIEGKNAVALNKNGDFIKIKNDDRYHVGFEVEIPSNTLFNFSALVKVLPAAAAFLIFISLGLGAYGYTRPYSYVDVDINPSIEITSNIFDRIIKVEGLNDDGKKLLSENTYNNKDINDGIEDILKLAVSRGYLVSSSTSAVMLTVSGKDNEKVGKIENEIQKTVDKELKNAGAQAEIMVENVSLKSHEEAIKQGISPGKLLLIERLIKVNPDAKVEDYKNATVKEIVKKINSDKEKLKEDRKDKKIEDNDNESNEKDNNNTDEKSDKVDKADKQKQRKSVPDAKVKTNKDKHENKDWVKDNNKSEDAVKQDKYEKNKDDEEVDKEGNDSDSNDKKQRNGKIKDRDSGDSKDRKKLRGEYIKLN